MLLSFISSGHLTTAMSSFRCDCVIRCVIVKALEPIPLIFSLSFGQQEPKVNKNSRLKISEFTVSLSDINMEVLTVEVKFQILKKC